MKTSKHFDERRQQRCIPPAIVDYLYQFGKEEHDGHGGIRKYFDHTSIKKMSKTLGSNFVSQISKFLRVYIVESTFNGQIITAGWRYEKFKHR